jgi:hypothetical protein
MSDSAAPERPGSAPSASWIPWVAALIGFGFQIIWFSSQFGSLSARIEDSERRVAAIEQNGSPVVQAVRTEVSINSRRISTLEDQYASKVGNLLVDNATHNERLSNRQTEIAGLRQWRLAHVEELANFGGRVGALESRFQELRAEEAALAKAAVDIPRPRPRS